jgi:hypothetical protein
MISVCSMCLRPRVVPGPRNEKRYGFCGSKDCYVKGGLELAAEDMLSREEADQLNSILSSEPGSIRERLLLAGKNPADYERPDAQQEIDRITGKRTAPEPIE